MPRGNRYVVLEGQFEKEVLGVFSIIRGFADLRDLAEVSVAYEMQNGQSPQQAVQGHQRQIDPLHAERIKQYLPFRCFGCMQPKPAPQEPRT